ncbi:hypothetical protein KFK09_019371 [Dendrobium nobile]|uniref:WRKY domain-containing protein n=1 Tax=Dendrobium nobile TaxID=94219 RepID=A0A8T3AQ13_DENNO|nr:hypothetical protein KFK09_019371 [Dendrobium nobile]
MESMASSETTIIDEEQVQEQNIVVAFGNGLVVISEDGYKWKKYGQKYIRSIQKNRSYFKCVNNNCKARKKVEWQPNDPNNIDIAYKGDHNHRALVGRLENEEAGIAANQYDLATQMFGSTRA